MEVWNIGGWASDGNQVKSSLTKIDEYSTKARLFYDSYYV